MDNKPPEGLIETSDIQKVFYGHQSSRKSNMDIGSPKGLIETSDFHKFQVSYMDMRHPKVLI